MLILVFTHKNKRYYSFHLQNKQKKSQRTTLKLKMLLIFKLDAVAGELPSSSLPLPFAIHIHINTMRTVLCYTHIVNSYNTCSAQQKQHQFKNSPWNCT